MVASTRRSSRPHGWWPKPKRRLKCSGRPGDFGLRRLAGGRDCSLPGFRCLQKVHSPGILHTCGGLRSERRRARLLLGIHSGLAQLASPAPGLIDLQQTIRAGDRIWRPLQKPQQRMRNAGCPASVGQDGCAVGKWQEATASYSPEDVLVETERRRRR